MKTIPLRCDCFIKGIGYSLQASMQIKNVKMSSFKSSENIQKKKVGQTDLFRIINPAVTAGKNIKMSSFKSSEKKGVGQTDLFRIINPLQ